jgi:hypothetical protein
LNSVIYVPADFKAIEKNVSVKVPTGEKRKALFGGEKDVMRSETRFEQTGRSERLVDGERLAVAEAVASLNSDGYELGEHHPSDVRELRLPVQVRGHQQFPEHTFRDREGERRRQLRGTVTATLRA